MPTLPTLTPLDLLILGLMLTLLAYRVTSLVNRYHPRPRPTKPPATVTRTSARSKPVR